MRKRDKWNPFGDPSDELKKLDAERVKKRERYQKKQPADSQANKNFHRKMGDL
jgi:hypothetical protein